MKQSILLFLLCMFIINQGCKEVLPNKLPPITAEGKGTFGYEADGEVQEGCVEGLFQSAHTIGHPNDSTFTLNGSCNDHTLTVLLIEKNKLEESKDYKFYFNGSWMMYNSPEEVQYRSNFADEGHATINFHKIDLANKIIAGTFSGTLFSQDGQQVEITNGRFDKTF